MMFVHRSCRQRAGIGYIPLIIIGLVILVIVWFIASLAVSKPLVISTETTYITEPLKSNGSEVDYFAAIEKDTYPANIATKENGFRLLVQHIDTLSDCEEWHFAQICQKLGLDANAVKPDMHFDEPYAFLEKYVKSDAFDKSIVERLLNEHKNLGDEVTEDVESEVDSIKVLSDRYGKPWTLDDLPMMEDWLRENGPALDLINEAVRKPSYHIPIARRDENESLITMLLPSLQRTRSFARGLSVRAWYRIGVGDIDGAIDDIVSVNRLGRHVGHGATLIDLLVGIACEGIAESIGIGESVDHLPTKAQIQRLIDELNSLPARAEFVDCMRVERFMGLEVLQGMAHGRDASECLGSEHFPAPAMMAVSFDWNLIMTRMNEHYDRIIDDRLPPPKVSIGPMDFFSRGSRSKTIADIFGNLLIPAVSAAEDATRRCQCCTQLKHITLAMLLYQRDHGSLPPAYSVDAQGTPLHSWRVLLLPYLGQDDLYKKIRLDEPWDSPYNQTLHGEDVAFYCCPSETTTKQGDTTYSVIVGPEMPFEAGTGKKLAELGPKRPNMILVTERAMPVCWMDPTQEISQEVADQGLNVKLPPGDTSELPKNRIASQHPGGAQFGFRGGEVRFVGRTVDSELFRQLLRGTDRNDY